MAVTSGHTRRSAGTGAGSSPLCREARRRSPASRLARSLDHSPPSLPHRSSPASAAPSTDAGEEPADPAEQALQLHLGGVEHWLLGAGDLDSSQTTQRAESLLADVSAEAATGVKGIR